MDWGYVAGFLDGEGTIHLRKESYSARISIVNTNKEVLEQIREFVNLGKIREYPRRHLTWKILYRYDVDFHDDVENFLEQVLPYLVIKKSQALKALERLGKSIRPGQGRLRRIPIETIIKLFKSGKNQIEIAKIFDISHSAVSAYMKACGYSAYDLKGRKGRKHPCIDCGKLCCIRSKRCRICEVKRRGKLSLRDDKGKFVKMQSNPPIFDLRELRALK